MATSAKIRGYGSAERPLAGELWRRESHQPGAPALTAHGNFEPNNGTVDYDRYFSPARAKAEQDHIWSKNWLFVGREEDIPNVGDRMPLQVGPHSWFIVRSAPDAFKAFHNSCLHRGTMLCAKHESAETIRCPYHAWEWNVDGRLKRIPSHWDFPELTRLNASLPEVKLERWGGFLFINADKDAAPLRDALGPMPEHFAQFRPERRYTAARFRKLVKANWKISQEAFMEAYHLYATHPEAVPFNGDSQTQYDIWQGEHGHVGRNASCSATPSMHAPSDATVLNAGQMFAQAMRDWHYPDAAVPQIDPKGDVRAQLGEWHRAVATQFYGRPIDLADAIMMDSFLYFMYPHMGLWLSESVPFTYQFLPHETDPEQSWFDVRLLLPCPEGRPTPPSAPAVVLDADQSVFQHCPDFGFLGFVFDQDMSNMPLIQKGAHSADPASPRTRLGAYQEMIIQHWNKVMDDQIAQGEAAKG
ncbi:aromatic ring-hydroxylating oxygenase subunit alpha [Sphingobium yanoikuyae]|uniref:aromatic ring-hydroxylating oxygenase subunit alpha n=1 Tax=Sphingobium yanoikuyae TaxID=13690 RepID=UPI0026F2B6B7|nr:aromatic ring-hydroxylating dioxygenase subunit alpha [Sphingobium yanoikuyae]